MYMSIYFKAQNDYVHGIAATVGGVCSKDKGFRTAITEWTESDLTTAFIWDIHNNNGCYYFRFFFCFSISPDPGS